MRSLVVALSLCLLPATGLAQDYVGISFSGTIPDQPLGLDLRSVTEGEVGGFFHFQGGPVWGRSSDETYEELSEITARDVYGDERLGSGNEVMTIGGGVTYGMSERFHIWGGAGVTVATTYVEYRDPMHILAEDGTYWVSPEGLESQLGVTVIGGVGVWLSNNMLVLAGGNANPAGIMFGVGYGLPGGL